MSQYSESKREMSINPGLTEESNENIILKTLISKEDKEKNYFPTTSSYSNNFILQYFEGGRNGILNNEIKKLNKIIYDKEKQISLLKDQIKKYKNISKNSKSKILNEFLNHKLSIEYSKEKQNEIEYEIKQYINISYNELSKKMLNEVKKTKVFSIENMRFSHNELSFIKKSLKNIFLKLEIDGNKMQFSIENKFKKQVSNEFGFSKLLSNSLTTNEHEAKEVKELLDIINKNESDDINKVNNNNNEDKDKDKEKKEIDHIEYKEEIKENANDNNQYQNKVELNNNFLNTFEKDKIEIDEPNIIETNLISTVKSSINTSSDKLNIPFQQNTIPIDTISNNNQNINPFQQFFINQNNNNNQYNETNTNTNNQFNFNNSNTNQFNPIQNPINPNNTDNQIKQNSLNFDNNPFKSFVNNDYNKNNQFQQTNQLNIQTPSVSHTNNINPFNTQSLNYSNTSNPFSSNLNNKNNLSDNISRTSTINNTNMNINNNQYQTKHSPFEYLTKTQNNFSNINNNQNINMQNSQIIPNTNMISSNTTGSMIFNQDYSKKNNPFYKKK